MMILVKMVKKKKKTHWESNENPRLKSISSHRNEREFPQKFFWFQLENLAIKANKCENKKKLVWVTSVSDVYLFVVPVDLTRLPKEGKFISATLLIAHLFMLSLSSFASLFIYYFFLEYLFFYLFMSRVWRIK